MLSFVPLVCMLSLAASLPKDSRRPRLVHSDLRIAIANTEWADREYFSVADDERSYDDARQVDSTPNFIEKRTVGKKRSNLQSRKSEPIPSQVDSRFYHVPCEVFNSCPVSGVPLAFQDLDFLPSESSGFCRSRISEHVDPGRLWPQKLLAVECVCDEPHCGERDSKLRCVNVNATLRVLRLSGWQNVAVPVGCKALARVAFPRQEFQKPELQ